MQETLKIKSETKKLREERERMSEELLQKKHELDQLKTRKMSELADERGKTGEARLKFRLKYSRFIVQSIMKAQQRMKDEKDVKKYGKMVMRAVNYVLDDKEAFQLFLTNGDVEIHNIAIERCFRHI